MNGPEQHQQKFLELYLPVKDRVWRYVRSMSDQLEDARDMESEVVLIAFRDFQKLKNKEAFMYYLFGIARNLVRQRERRRKLKELFMKEKKQEWHFSDPGMNVDVEQLYKVLAILPFRQREAIVLFDIDGLSLKEVMEVQQDGLSAVKSRISRGRKKLAELLNAENDQTLAEKGTGEKEDKREWKVSKLVSYGTERKKA